MIKGIFGMLLGALIAALVIIGLIYLLFSGILLWLAAILIGGVIVAALVLFVIIFVFAIIIFFAFFYYVAEKKPTMTPGNYTLEMEKGKHEEKNGE